MSLRKTVGWLVFSSLIAVLLSQTPRVAGEACPKSVLYEAVEGVDDLDNMGEDF